MSATLEKFGPIFEEAIGRLIARAENPRGMDISDLKPRIVKAAEKYLFGHSPNAGRIEIMKFIDEIRADDLCLILACENGDEHAWEELVAEFDQTVRSAARKMCSKAEDAEDLAGSIWAELHGLRRGADGSTKSKLAYYSGRGSLAGWLRAVVAQLAVDQFRKQSRLVQFEEERDLDNLANQSDGSNNWPKAAKGTPEDLLAERMTAADIETALHKAIGELAAEDRLFLKLYYFDELRLRDIAETFGFHEATASRKLVRIQAEIRNGVERNLRNKHGWNESEVRRHLSATVLKLNIDLEKMIAVAIIMLTVQEFVI